MSIQHTEHRRLLMNGSTTTDTYPTDLLNRELYITKSGYLVSRVSTDIKPLQSAYSNRIMKPAVYAGSHIIDIGYKLDTGSVLSFNSVPVFQVGTVEFDFGTDYFNTLKTKKLFLSSESYGTSLPTTASEGQIFFKII